MGEKVGVKKGDVVHLLTCGGDLDIFFVVIAAWTLGAVPAFGESTLAEDALLDQVREQCFMSCLRTILNLLQGGVIVNSLGWGIRQSEIY